MKLSLITNELEVAKAADAFGIDRIMIDLEHKGKEARQTGLGLFLSDHRIEDVSVIKKELRRASLLVRVDSPNELNQEKIDRVIALGADCIMLPYFHSVEQVLAFTEMVDGRSKISLLVETDASVNCLDVLSTLPFVDEFHIGLNDLQISRNYRSIFEPLLTGELERICHILQYSGKPYGFGGIGKLSNTALPVNPRHVLAEQIRLGCNIGWLGRSFREGMNQYQLEIEIKQIRAEIDRWQQASLGEFEKNTASLHAQIKAWEKRTDR